ncbi:hypothetical protein BH23PAT1_BH23PAT1_5240 [soil metagenome]
MFHLRPWKNCHETDSMNSRLWILVGRTAYWTSWPLLFVAVYFSKRTRVLVTSGDKVLVVKGWLSDGGWNLPGGGLHMGEAAALGACRELKEETSISVLPEQLIHVHTKRVWEDGVSYTQILFTLKLQKPREVIRQKWELTDAAWISQRDLPENSQVSRTITLLLNH